MSLRLQDILYLFLESRFKGLNTISTNLLGLLGICKDYFTFVIIKGSIFHNAFFGISLLFLNIGMNKNNWLNFSNFLKANLAIRK